MLTPDTIYFPTRQSAHAMIHLRSRHGVHQLSTRHRRTGQQGDQLPWGKKITVDDDFGVLVTAIPRGKDTTVKRCRIAIDGKQQRNNEANGMATCAYVYVGKP